MNNQYTYNNTDLEEEFRLVHKYINKKGYYKQHPSQYLEKILDLAEQLYTAFSFMPQLDKLESPIITQAFQIAEVSHHEQERKYTHSAYLIHLREVASRLTTIDGVDANMIIAGILHDWIEKGQGSFEELERVFGKEVHEHVYFLTDHIKEGKKDDRTVQNFSHFIKGPRTTKNIKLIDILSNTRSIIVCDAGFNVSYMKHMQYMNEFFQNSLDVEKDLKNLLAFVMDVGNKTLKLQEQFNIVKLDKKPTKIEIPYEYKYQKQKLF